MDAFVYEAVRTPRGRGREGGALAGVKPIELLEGLYAEVARRAPAVAREADDVILGCVTQSGEQGSNLAKISAVYAGFGARAGGATVNRFCVSGLDAIHAAAAKCASGMAELVVAGGVESMSRAPMTSDGGAWFQDPAVAARTGFVHMGVAADLLATRAGLTRDDLDAWAARSHERAARARAEGRFARSLVPVKGPGGAALLDHDECVREGTTREKLAKLPAAFVAFGAAGFDAVALAKYPDAPVEHRHTIGTSPAIADAASLVVIGTEAAGKAHGLAPRARVLAFADVGDEPVQMLAGNVPATKKALAKAGLRAHEIHVFEVNESFAAVPLHYARALELDEARVAPNGGALALGHPLGATGGILLATALDELERTGGRYAVLSICGGAGVASATVLERL